MSTRNDWRPGNIKRVHHAQQRRQHEDVPHLHMVRQRERRQHKRQQHRRDLRPDDDVLAVGAIGDDSSDRRKQKHRNLAGKSYRAQQQSRAGQPVDKPRLGHGLHPRADQRNQLSAEKKLEVAMPQGASRRLPAASLRRCARCRREMHFPGWEFFDSATIFSLDDARHLAHQYIVSKMSVLECQPCVANVRRC